MLTAAARDKLAQVSTATITTVLFKRGLRNQFLQGPQVVNPRAPRLVGPAYTLRYIPAHLADEVEFVNMLVDEARVASRIHHPNAVPILDLAESAQGYYLVMDYIEGATLTQVRTSKVLSDDEKTRIGLRMLVDALSGLHAAQLLRVGG